MLNFDAGVGTTSKVIRMLKKLAYKLCSLSPTIE